MGVGRAGVGWCEGQLGGRGRRRGRCGRQLYWGRSPSKLSRSLSSGAVAEGEAGGSGGEAVALRGGLMVRGRWCRRCGGEDSGERSSDVRERLVASVISTSTGVVGGEAGGGVVWV